MKKVTKVLVGALGAGVVSYLIRAMINEKKASDVRNAIKVEDFKSEIAFKEFLKANSFKSESFKFASSCATTPIYTFSSNTYINGKPICPDTFIIPEGYVLLKVSTYNGSTVYAIADALDVDDAEALFAEYHVCFYLDDETDWIKLVADNHDCKFDDFPDHKN